MPLWKRNLIVCWFGMFLSGIGMSLLMPVLPLYIRQLGVHNTGLIEQFSGIAFGVTYIVSAIFSPIWGYAADKYGRKPMLLRASLGMAVIIFAMGFAQNVYELIGLRFLQGLVNGYGAACTTLIATQTDVEHAGWALGALSTSNVAGSLIGPMLGGYIGENFGLQNVFFAIGILLFVAFMTNLFLVKENFIREDKKALSLQEMWRMVPDKSTTMIMFATSFISTLALYSIEPIVTVYVAQISPHTRHVALIAGIVFSASGLANIIAAPRLGKLADKIGAQKVMVATLLVAGLVYIPQAFAKNPWQLTGLRFLLGLATAGLIPIVTTLLKKITPPSLTGGVLGLSIGAIYVGGFGGAVLGGQLAARLGIRSIFFISSVLMLLNAGWVYWKVAKKKSSNPG